MVLFSEAAGIRVMAALHDVPGQAGEMDAGGPDMGGMGQKVEPSAFEPSACPAADRHSMRALGQVVCGGLANSALSDR